MEAFENKPVKITENTLIPISLIIGIAVVIITGTLVYAQTADNTRDIAKQEVLRETDRKTLVNMAKDIAEIKGALGIKKRKDQPDE